MFVLIVGCGRVGSAIANSMLAEGHEVSVLDEDPEAIGLVHLLDLPEERLEIIELEVAEGSEAAGRAVKDLGLPDGSLVISILRDGGGFVPAGDSIVQAGDEVLLVLDVGIESRVTERFTTRSAAA